MSKKRSCRRTPDESKMHEKAVQIRKMTDEQIIEFLDGVEKESYHAGYKHGVEVRDAGKSKEKKASDLLRYLQENKINGVGNITIKKIIQAASENGYM